MFKHAVHPGEILKEEPEELRYEPECCIMVIEIIANCLSEMVQIAD